MFYSRMAEHAMTALGELARHPGTGFVPTARISEATSIPRPILTKVIAALAHAGLIKTREGRHGGARLARSAEEIRLFDVVVAFDGDEIFPVCPIHLRGCVCSEACRLHNLWTEASEGAHRFLAETTIADVSVALGRQPK